MNELQKIRTKMGLSLREMASRAQLSFTTLSRWEARHVKRPSVTTLTKISAAYGVKPQELMSWVEIGELDFSQPTTTEGESQ